MTRMNLWQGRQGGGGRANPDRQGRHGTLGGQQAAAHSHPRPGDKAQPRMCSLIAGGVCRLHQASGALAAMAVRSRPGLGPHCRGCVVTDCKRVSGAREGMSERESRAASRSRRLAPRGPSHPPPPCALLNWLSVLLRQPVRKSSKLRQEGLAAMFGGASSAPAQPATVSTPARPACTHLHTATATSRSARVVQRKWRAPARRGAVAQSQMQPCGRPQELHTPAGATRRHPCSRFPLPSRQLAPSR